MKKILLIILIIAGLGLFLNTGSSFRFKSEQTGGSENCSVLGLCASITEKRGWPFEHITELDTDEAPPPKWPVFLSNQAFWMGVSSVLFGMFHFLKKMVSRAVLIGLAVAAVLVYVGVLNIA